MRSLFVGTPVHSACTPGYVRTVLALAPALAARGIAMLHRFHENDSNIAHARAAVAGDCVDSGADRYLLLDSDVEVDPATILRLVDLDVDFACAAYPKRSIDLHAFAKALRLRAPDPESLAHEFVLGLDRGSPPTIRNGAILSRHGALGCALLKPVVFERLIAAHPELRFTNEDDSREMHALFNGLLVDGVLQGEDVSFCTRWRAVGGEIWTLVDAEMAHGAHRGNVGAWIEALANGTADPEARREVQP